MACAICDDTGWKTVDVDGVPRVERCDCWHQRLYDSLLKEARIPRRYAHCEFSNFDLHTDSQREAHKKAAALVDKFPVNSDRGLLFFGDHGVGKTHLAAALLKELIRRKGARAVFFESRELLKIVRDTYSNDSQITELEALKPALEAEVLVLDDLGAEKKSEWVSETLGLIVNTRYSEKRVTIITTNLADVDNTEPTSFAFQLGLRIRSRLLEMCDWIRIEGVDTREVGPQPTHEQIARWQQTSPGSPKNRPKGSLPSRTAGQARASLKPRASDSQSSDLKWPGGRAGSR